MTKNATSSNKEPLKDSGSENTGELLSSPFAVDQDRKTFKKEERLCHKRAFDHLFKGGSSFYKGSLWVIYTTDLPEYLQTHPMMVGFSVPKRSFQRANKRNYLKRRLKEAYRLHKHMMLPYLKEENKQLCFLVKYNTRKILSYHEIEADMIRVFSRLHKSV